MSWTTPFAALVISLLQPLQQQPPPVPPPPPTHEETVVVEATRTSKRLEDVPLRVEVLVREEIEEKMLMTPGDIVMMLNEMGGLRVQATSPSLGAATVRVHGLPGRYTQFLVDGLPLFGHQPSGIGLLQTPPMDIGRVEVIKGVASALYGSSALAGVVNLVSRRPADDHAAEVLLNQTTRAGTDGLVWLSGPLAGHVGYSFIGGAHLQSRQDVDADGWSDLPKYRRVTARPRLFWSSATGSSWLLTGGVVREDRSGGGTPPSGGPYVEALDTTRVDAGFSGRWPAGATVITLRTSVSRAAHLHRFGEIQEADRHRTGFVEAAIIGGRGRHAWVAGGAWQSDTYQTDVPGAGYAHHAPALFGQHDFMLSPRVTMSASARVERLGPYGVAVSPRFSALFRPGDWTVRSSIGAGRAAPTPLTEDTESIGLSRVRIDGALEPERGISGTLDVVRSFETMSFGVTGFASRIRNPLALQERGGELILDNAAGPIRTGGVELLGRYKSGAYSLTLSHLELDATEQTDAGRVRVPLQPRRSSGLVGMWEEENRGRVGVELYYTGRQRLDDDPFRSESSGYVILGALAEWQIGRARVFLNGENLGDTRLTNYSRFVRPSRALDGRWTVDAWAPLEGRTINGGVRILVGS
jgi:outer membrane receptor for ferrienterochelin and colicins